MPCEKQFQPMEPAATRMINVAINQWMRKGQTKDFVRQATQPKANPPKIVESASTSGLPTCANANGTACNHKASCPNLRVYANRIHPRKTNSQPNRCR